MISFGMPTLIELHSLDECAALCRSLRLDFIELNMNLPACQLHALDPLHLRRLSEEYSLFFTIHLDENLNVADFNPYVADAYRRTVLETIDLTKEIGAPLLNMHLPRGVYFTLPGRKTYLFQEYRSDYLKKMRLFRDECAARIGQSGIIMTVENTGGFLPFQLEALDLLLEKDCFALTLDVGHSHAAGRCDEAFIQDWLPALRHMHLHDALGQADHLPLGAGEADIPYYMRLARENGCRVVLETKTVSGLRQSVEWLKGRAL